MKIFQKADGGVLKSTREYDIAPTTAIMAGQVVCLAAGLVVAAVAAQTGTVLGIAAETHSGTEDAMNPRSNGPKIMVWDAPDLIMQCAAPQAVATGGTATTITADSLVDTGLTGGYAKLISKAEGSTNADAVGKIRRITASAAKSITLESGGIPTAGDVYEIYPPLGFAGGNLDAERSAIVLNASCALALKVVGHDRELGRINFIAAKHFLGNDV